MQEFLESPIEPKCPALKSFAAKIKEKGFNFHPGKVLEALNKEAERQYNEIFTECFQGSNIKTITSAQEETYAWMQSEDERYSKWQQEQKLMAMAPQEVLVEEPMPAGESTQKLAELAEVTSSLAEVTSIKSKKGKRK